MRRSVCWRYVGGSCYEYLGSGFGEWSYGWSVNSREERLLGEGAVREVVQSNAHSQMDSWSVSRWGDRRKENLRFTFFGGERPYSVFDEEEGRIGGSLWRRDLR